MSTSNSCPQCWLIGDLTCARLGPAPYQAEGEATWVDFHPYWNWKHEEAPLPP